MNAIDLIVIQRILIATFVVLLLFWVEEKCEWRENEVKVVNGRRYVWVNKKWIRVDGDTVDPADYDELLDAMYKDHADDLI
jgi:hypothetical protein